MRKIQYAAICFALVSSPVHAQINKCVDAGGKTVYSQAPCPPSSKSSNVRPAVSTPKASAASIAKDDEKAASAKTSIPKTTAELERDFRKRRSDQDEASKKETEKLAEAQVREENCKASRTQLANLESGARQATVDAGGQRRFLDEAEIARGVASARKSVQSWCK